MMFYALMLLFYLYFSVEGGITGEIPPDTSEGEVVIETVTDDTWMPSNIFDAQVVRNVEESEKSLSEEPPWNADSSPLFRAIRDFIFQGGDGLVEDRNDDPTEEIVKILEKGLIEATTMFLTPSDEDPVTSAVDTIPPNPISVIKIEGEASENLLDRIGVNALDFASSRQESMDRNNTTAACSDCYNTLESCVLQCFMKNNCNDVQRQARACHPPSGRLCNIFTQWDECKVHDDCRSPLLCCNDGCVNKCSEGIWRN